MNTVFDLVPRFTDILRDLEDLKMVVVNQSGVLYESQDARLVALDSMQATVASTGMWINGCGSIVKSCTDVEVFNEKKFLKELGSGKTLQETELLMFDNLRLGFMTLIHFKLDSLFHNILKHLNALPAKKGYWNLTDSILGVAGIATPGPEKDILSAFANLRNSLHGNGIHRTQSLSINLDNKNFDFVKDQKVECASWEHVVVLLEHNIKVLSQILTSQNISNINVEIADDFASTVV